MLNQPQLEKALSISYPNIVSASTQNKRFANINALIKNIKNANEDYDLKYTITEERLTLYQTTSGEKVAIQYPGQETMGPNEGKIRPYDFRPRIIDINNNVVKDLDFADMWSIVEDINKNHHAFIKSLSALFFRMGRMIDNHSITKSYEYEVISISDSRIIATGNRELSWNQLAIDHEIIESLNFHIPCVYIDTNTSISFEAFLYFFSLILENEDIKYYYKKRNLTSGRIPTSDSMLLLSSYFSGSTSISTLLQRYVSGYGVGKCLSSEIGPATCGLVKIVNRKEELIKRLSSANMPFKEGATITVSGTPIRTAIKVNNPKTAILRFPNKKNEELLSSRDWMVFDLETSVLDESHYNRLLTYLQNNK